MTERTYQQGREDELGDTLDLLDAMRREDCGSSRGLCYATLSLVSAHLVKGRHRQKRVAAAGAEGRGKSDWAYDDKEGPA